MSVGPEGVVIRDGIVVLCVVGELADDIVSAFEMISGDIFPFFVGVSCEFQILHPNTSLSVLRLVCAEFAGLYARRIKGITNRYGK